MSAKHDFVEDNPYMIYTSDKDFALQPTDIPEDDSDDNDADDNADDNG